MKWLSPGRTVRPAEQPEHTRRGAIDSRVLGASFSAATEPHLFHQGPGAGDGDAIHGRFAGEGVAQFRWQSRHPAG